jgi:hypothetical protein
MIQHDYISEIFIVLAVSIFLYLFTIVGTAVVLFPIILLLSGMGLHNFVRHRHSKNAEEEDFDDTEITNEHLWKNLIFDTVVALFGVFLVNQAINIHGLAVSSGLTGGYAFLFEVLIGIAEEEFFRGFLTDWILTSLPKGRFYPFDALMISAFGFLIYHFAIYGTEIQSLLYVLGGGFILSWTAYHSLHVSPCMTGHMLNNVGAYISQSAKITTSVTKATRTILKVIK